MARSVDGVMPPPFIFTLLLTLNTIRLFFGLFGRTYAKLLGTTPTTTHGTIFTTWHVRVDHGTALLVNRRPLGKAGIPLLRLRLYVLTIVKHLI